MNKQKIIEQIQKTINELSNNPDEADTIKALKKQMYSFMDCIHKEKTNHTVRCRTCGGARYIYCKKKKLKINERLCNHQNCEYFKINEDND
jgi:hypothetical protein